MATNFPASLDTLTNPVSGDSLASPSHAAQHANVNDAVEALEAKVGVDGSAVTSSLDYKVAQQGLTFIKSQTIGTGVSSVTVTDAFSSTFENYLITVSNCVGSADTNLKMQLGSNSSGYYSHLTYGSYLSATVSGANGNNVAQWDYAGGGGGGGSVTAYIELMQPNLAITKQIRARVRYSTVYGTFVGHTTFKTVETAFTLFPSTGTLTGGTVRVYGLNNG